MEERKNSISRHYSDECSNPPTWLKEIAGVDVNDKDNNGF
jgi:hypothetical protein